MKTFIKLILCVFTMSCLYSGCGKEKDITETAAVSPEFPKEILSDLTDRIRVQAQCIYPEACKTGTAKKAKLGEGLFWDKKEQIKQLFLENKIISEEYVNDFSSMKEAVYTTDDETLLLITTNNYLTYSSPKAADIQNVIFTEEQFSDYNGDQYLKTTDLSFSPQQKAWEEVQKFLQKLGVEVSDDFTCYVMDHSTMEQEEKRLNREAQETGEKTTYKESGWTTADDCYYFVCRTTWEDYLVLPPISGEGIDENNVHVIYGQEGILGVSVSGYYPLQESESVTVQNPEKIIEKVRETLENIISEDTYEIQKITLCQKVTNFQYQKHIANILPVWECQILVRNGQEDDYEYIQKLYFDAETLTGVR